MADKKTKNNKRSNVDHGGEKAMGPFSGKTYDASDQRKEDAENTTKAIEYEKIKRKLTRTS